MHTPPISSQQIKGMIFLIICGVVIGLSVTILLPFLSAILWGMTLSVLTYSWFEGSRRKYELVRESGAKGLRGKIAHMGDSIAALKSTFITLVVICLPFILVGGLAVAQISPALKEMQGTQGFEITDRIDRSIHPIMEKVGLHEFHVQDWWTENSEEIVRSLRQPASNVAKQAGITVFTMVVALLSMFFFQRDGKALKKPFLEFSGLPTHVGEEIFVKVQKTIKAVFSGSVMVAIIQGTIMGITYALLGVPNSALLGFISVVLCIVPLLGAPIIYIPVGLLFLAQGDVTKALVVMGVGFLIVSQIDNVLKPYFIGNQVQLHPLAIFFFVLGGISLFGPIGLMVGPMVLTLFLALVDYTRSLLNLPDDNAIESVVDNGIEPA
jgi:predicted PurR-regulated permease PerM